MISFYINWFDVIIIALLALVVWRSLKIGLTTQFLVGFGFFVGLFAGGWIFPHLLPIHDATQLTVVNTNLVLLLALVLAVGGYAVGRRIHLSIKRKWPRRLDTYLSVIFSLSAGLIAVWIIATMIGRLPFVGLGNSANDSLIVQNLEQNLPPIPAVFTFLNQRIDPSNPPKVYIRTKIQTEQYIALESAALRQAADVAESSIVRITSFGCGGIVSGSGFVVAPDLVMTNAHVIAGVHRPVIKSGRQSYAGTPVLFDQTLDIAVLRVNGLQANPLTIAPEEFDATTLVAALGYPGGNYAAVPGTIWDEQNIFSKNLYGVGTFGRKVYIVKVILSGGSSGGPLILQDGRVAGVVFAQSDTDHTIGYAVTSASVITPLQQAQKSTRRVSTGSCVSLK